MLNKILNLKTEIQKPACRQAGLRSRGFSMVELLVVVAIVAVLSVSAVVGFGRLGDFLKIREISGLVSDSLQHEELKVLRGDLEKATLYFLKDYLVINEEFSDADLVISFDATACANGYQIKHVMKTGMTSASLNKTDEEGRSVEVVTVNKDDTDCVDFKDSAEREWNFQLTDGDLVSNKIRFVHFNANREKLENPVYIDTGAGFRVELKAPYAKRYYYDASNQSVSSLSIDFKNDSDAAPETLTLK